VNPRDDGDVGALHAVNQSASWSPGPQPVRVMIRCTPEDQWAAASIWAEATARRDNLLSPVPAATKLHGIQQTLALPGATLHLARRGSRVCGFAALVPSGQSLEIRYLAAASNSWGTGVGTDLLDHVHEHAQGSGFSSVDLWVIDSNARAIALYERGGWLPTEDVKSQVRTKRVERRFVLRVQGDANSR
jgi:ribosomal protein S18 acetylase RimI-like enzyme